MSDLLFASLKVQDPEPSLISHLCFVSVLRVLKFYINTLWNLSTKFTKKKKNAQGSASSQIFTSVDTFLLRTIHRFWTYLVMCFNSCFIAELKWFDLWYMNVYEVKVRVWFRVSYLCILITVLNYKLKVSFSSIHLCMNISMNTYRLRFSYISIYREANHYYY